MGHITNINSNVDLQFGVKGNNLVFYIYLYLMEPVNDKHYHRKRKTEDFLNVMTENRLLLYKFFKVDTLLWFGMVIILVLLLSWFL